MQTSLLSLLALPALALAACDVGDYYCPLTSKGWKPAAASYLVTEGVTADNAYTRFYEAYSTASITIPSGLSAAASAAEAAYTSKGGDSPEEYTIINAEISQLPEDARQPAQSVIAKALALQNAGAAAPRPTEFALMAMAGAAAAGVAGLAL